MNLATWALIGAAFSLIVGVLMHYVYDYSKQNRIIAIFGSVNESVWEHLKLIFWPMIFFGIIEFFSYGENIESFIPIRSLSIFIGMFIITVVYYVSSRLLKNNTMIINIATFVLAIIFSYFFSLQIFLNNIPYITFFSTLGWVLLPILIISFFLFTFFPPKIDIFHCPQDNHYGIPRKK